MDSASSEPQNESPITSEMLRRAALGKPEAVRSLIEDEYFDVNTRLSKGQRLIHACAKHSASLTSLTLLARNGADVNVTDDANGSTPLHIAAAENRTEAVRLLLDIGADVGARDLSGDTPLGEFMSSWRCSATPASSQPSIYAGLLLVSSGADVNTRRGYRGRTLLHFAAEVGRATFIRQLCEMGANVNVVDDGGMTALHVAGEKKHTHVISELVHFGANAEIVSYEGATPLSLYASSGDHAHSLIDTMLFLIRSGGANVNTRVGGSRSSTPLHFAIAARRADAVHFLIESGADANARDCDGVTPLLSLFSFGDAHHFTYSTSFDSSSPPSSPLTWNAHVNFVMEAATLLVRGGRADVDGTNKKYLGARSPLISAAKCGCVELIRFLVSELGADVNAKNDFGETPLQQVALAPPYRLKVVQTLLELGANVNAQSHGNMSAFDCVMKRMKSGGNEELRLAEVLTAAGADVGNIYVPPYFD